jgi:stage II sporulation protein P
MVLRASRFNQHLSVGSVLVEVGTHGNTLREALAGVRLFGQSAAAVLTGLLSS